MAEEVQNTPQATISVPDIMFHMRQRVEKKGKKKKGEDANPYEWVYNKSSDLFAGKKVVVVGLPGAFTPTCTNAQLPGFEELAQSFYDKGVDEIWCTSVNDAFVMHQWAEHLGIKNVKMLPDGSGEFAASIGMLVDKTNLGFGKRSWRYAIVIDDLKITGSLVEAGLQDKSPLDPYELTKPEFVLENLL